METTFEAVILANGTFPTHATPLHLLHQAQHVVCCDGAVTSFPAAEVVIGDGDSIPAAFHDRLIRIDEQDDNDLTKATRYCLQRGWHRIAYLGCTGKREDHTLGNISLLMRYYRDMDVEGILYTDYGFFTPAHGHRTFLSMNHQLRQPSAHLHRSSLGCLQLLRVVAGHPQRIPRRLLLSPGRRLLPGLPDL